MSIVSMVKGDFLFAQWDENGVDNFREKESELLSEGFKKVDEYGDYLNLYAVYNKNDKEITLTMMCC